MTGQQLKNSILQLAIQGKLVPQIESEGTAEDLLKEIRAEKERLVKEGKLKKKDLDVKPIEKDEIPFEIPSGWRWVKLKDIVSLITKGSSPSWQGVKYVDKGILFITSENVRDGYLDLKSPKYLEPKFNNLQSRSILKKGDILTNIVGASIGRTAEYNLDFCDANVNQAVAIIRLLQNSLIPFLLKLLNSPFVVIQMLGKTVDTARANISLGSIENLCIPLPPLSEQKRIVAKIEELMPLVEEYGKAQERLEVLNKELPEKLKKSVLQEAIMGKLVPQDPKEGTEEELLEEIRKEKEKLVKEGKLKKKDLEVKPIEDDEIPFEIPEGWRWCRLGEISNIWSARRVHEKDWRSSGIPFFRAREIGKLASEGTVDNELFIDKELYDEFSKSGLPQANDLMLTAVGTLGKAYIVKESDVFYYKDGSVLCLNNFGHLNPIFLKYAIESSMFVKQYQNESEGTTVSTLTIVRMNGYMLPIPPLAEQKRIVEKVEEVMEYLNKKI